MGCWQGKTKALYLKKWIPGWRCGWYYVFTMSVGETSFVRHMRINQHVRAPNFAQFSMSCVINPLKVGVERTASICSPVRNIDDITASGSSGSIPLMPRIDRSGFSGRGREASHCWFGPRNETENLTRQTFLKQRSCACSAFLPTRG